MTDEQPRYLSYLLRLWRVKVDGEFAWRASLESPNTGERRGFADLDSLYAFLVEMIDSKLCERSNEPTDHTLR